MKIIKPPIFGKITYLVPDKNETNGIDIIRINTLGSKILNARLPDLKLSPKTESMFSEKIKIIRQIIDAVIKSKIVDFLRICKIS